jgi:hypothetical protein
MQLHTETTLLTLDTSREGLVGLLNIVRPIPRDQKFFIVAMSDLCRVEESLIYQNEKELFAYMGGDLKQTTEGYM